MQLAGTCYIYMYFNCQSADHQYVGYIFCSTSVYVELTREVYTQAHKIIVLVQKAIFLCEYINWLILLWIFIFQEKPYDWDLFYSFSNMFGEIFIYEIFQRVFF